MAKAGILKHNRPVIVSDQQHEVVKAILREQASDLACDYISVKDTVAVETIHTELQSSGMRQEIEISMKGSWEGMARMWSDRVKTGMLVSSVFPQQISCLCQQGLMAESLCVLIMKEGLVTFPHNLLNYLLIHYRTYFYLYCRETIRIAILQQLPEPCLSFISRDM